MSKELFYAPQTYAMALECGRKLMANESEEDKLVPVIHQLNTRIYNSAFCGILRTGYPFVIEKDENGSPTFIKMEIDGIQHVCPYTSVSNMLRGEFTAVLKCGGYTELAAASPKKKQTSKLNETKAEHAVNTAAQVSTEEGVKKAKTEKNTEKRDIKSTGFKPTKSSSFGHEIPVNRVIPTFSSVRPDIHENIPMKKSIPEATTTPKEEAEEMATNTAKTVVVPTIGLFTETMPPTPLEEKPELDLDAIVATMENSGAGASESGNVQKNSNTSVALPQPDQGMDAHELHVNTNPNGNVPEKLKTVEDLTTQDRVRDMESKQDTAIHASESAFENKSVTSSKLTMDQEATDTRVQEKESASETHYQELHTDDIPTIQDAFEKTVPDSVAQNENNAPEELNEDIGMDDYGTFDAPVLDDETESAHEDIKTTQEDEMPDKDAEQSPSVTDQNIGADTEGPMSFEPKKNVHPVLYEEATQNTNDVSLEKPKPKHGFIASLLGIGSKNVKTEQTENGPLPEFQPNTKEKALTSIAEPNEQTPTQNMSESVYRKKETVEEAETEKTMEEVKDEASQNHTAVEEKTVSALTSEPAQNNTEPVKTDHSQDGGVLFQHIHQVTVKPKFGDAILSQVKFIIWPTRIVEMYPGRTFADLLIYVVDKNGVERSYCTERGQDMIAITTSDNKEFNVYGIWDNGHFTSYVTLAGRTESQNRMEETVEKTEPERTDSDAFLDQFRLERKGQPAHFIVPFKDHNCGERNIPITGYVELRGRKYPLERREGNMLRYRYNANEKIIRGHWEDGVFKFNLSDATLIDWSREEENETQKEL